VSCTEQERLLNEYKKALRAYGKTAGAYGSRVAPSSADADSAAASRIVLRGREEWERHVREHGCVTVGSE
jgi:hypothetical protein